jgi:hypothetical protein
MSMRKLLSRLVLVVLASAATTGAVATTALADKPESPAQPNFGPSVYIFNPGMPQSQIQATVDAVAAQQVSNQFGTQRYALLFEPGIYGSPGAPLIFQVGYYTTVAGLGASPNDVTINGAIDVFNQCSSGRCWALNNFWRSLSNLTITVTLPKSPPAYSPPSPDIFGTGCDNSGEMWATSQAAPMRRVQVNGFVTLFDYCSPNPFSSGGFIADSNFTGNTVLNGSQQQFLIRNSHLDGWINGVWNQVFSGDDGSVPAQSFGNVPVQSGGPQPYTTLATNPVTREAPFLFMDSERHFNVFVPSTQHNSSGTTWANGPTPGSSIPMDKFFIANPTDSAATINKALRRGKNLLLTPGVYQLDRSLEVTRPDTVVLGLGIATLTPEDGNVAMRTSANGVLLSGILFDAGAKNSPALLQVGSGKGQSDEDGSDPTALFDVFFRIGGAAAGKATTSLVVNSDNVILDNIWAWRADHGSGVGWTVNTADTGVIVNGDNVTAYGLFVEHYQKYQVIWKGGNGRVVMFQSEMPYDPPTQSAWSHGGVNGWAAIKVANSAEDFEGWGLGTYCVFNADPTIHAARAYEVPEESIKLHDLITVSLGGVGVIDHVVNNFGAPAQGAATIPVNVVSFPPSS